jgi:hypothetical protein
MDQQIQMTADDIKDIVASEVLDKYFARKKMNMYAEQLSRLEKQVQDLSVQLATKDERVKALEAQIASQFIGAEKVD